MKSDKKKSPSHDHEGHDHSHDSHDHHDHDGHNHGNNPFANLDEETQKQIHELQMIEQQFQQIMMQKNAYSMELNETDLVIGAVEKTDGEVSRIVGNQVIIKTTKEEILEEMNKKKDLLEKRMSMIDKQEAEFSSEMKKLRETVLKKIQG